MGRTGIVLREYYLQKTRRYESMQIVKGLLNAGSWQIRFPIRLV